MAFWRRLDWLGGLFKNADGGVYTSVGPPPTRDVALSTAPPPSSSPAASAFMAKLARGHPAPRARRRRCKLGAVAGGGGHTINVPPSPAPNALTSAAPPARRLGSLAALNGARRYGWSSSRSACRSVRKGASYG